MRSDDLGGDDRRVGRARLADRARERTLGDALVIAWLGSLLGDYYHQIALLYALVVAGHAVIHGFRAAMVMVVLGSLLVPIAITAGSNPTDPLFAFTYLLGVAAKPLAADGGR